MGTLIGWELKKILNRKVLWVAMILGLALLVWIDLTVMYYGTNGFAQGWHAAYALYEGQVVTDALHQQMQEDFSRYVAAHPDDFQEVWRDDNTGEVHYFANSGGYNHGLSAAYNWMDQIQTVEQLEAVYQRFSRALESGMGEDGHPLDYSTKRFYSRKLPRYAQKPVVHDALAWTEYFSQGGEGLPGLLAVSVTALALLGLYNGETSARMESVVLTTRARRRLAVAKLLSGGIVTLAVMAFYFALHTGLYVWAFSLTGASVPACTVFQAMDITGLTVWQAALLSFPVKALAVLMGASAVAWASAQFRQPLLSLLAATAVMAATMVGFISLATPQYSNSPILAPIVEYAGRLPLPVLLGEVLYDVVQPGPLVFLILSPVVIIVLLSVLSQRAFLRRRRA